MKKLFLFIFLIFSTALYSQSSKPYILLISFDGFRWDYLHRNITPNLQEMIDNGVQASSLQPAFPSKTFPNHYSIITGMYPEHHGIISNFFTNPLSGEKYRLGDTVSVRDAKWYRGEAFWETAERQGIKTASFFWPGSEVKLDYRRPTFSKKYDHHKPYTERIDTVVKWLNLPQNNRPHFVTMYFDATDTYGHKYDPNSDELNGAVKKLDSLILYLKNKLSVTTLKDSLNIIIVSDHGMTEVSPDKVIDIASLLDNFNVDISGNGPFMMINAEEYSDSVYRTLKKNELHYSVYKKSDIPEYYHFSENAFIGEILVIADLGWSLMNKKDSAKNFTGGAHGYSNHQIDMHGIFIAEGPEFKKNFKTGTILNIDIYPLLTKIFNLVEAPNIDGKLERIEFILKEEEK